MNKKTVKPVKNVISDSTIRAVSTELRQFWQSYSTGNIKLYHYAECVDKVYQKHKITKEEFRSAIDSWISSGKSL